MARRIATIGHPDRRTTLPTTLSSDRAARRSLLEHYLLGRLGERTRIALRAELLASADACAEMRDVELDLIDAYERRRIDHARTRLLRARVLRPVRNRTARLVSAALAARTLLHGSAPRALALQPSVRTRRRRGWRLVATCAGIAWAACVVCLVAGAGHTRRDVQGPSVTEE